MKQGPGTWHNLDNMDWDMEKGIPELGKGTRGDMDALAGIRVHKAAEVQA